MANLKDITGKRYGNLIVKGVSSRNPKTRKYKWECICDCGNISIVAGSNLTTGHTRSCGCIGNSSHEMSYSPEYSVWHGMIQRCYNKNYEKFYDYGGRGITTQVSWKYFENFYADMGQRPSDKHTIERRDTNGMYSKQNCYWTDDLGMQSYNQRRRNTNTSGRTGVREYGKQGKWLAEITVNYQTIHLGCFEDFELACFVREEAELKYYGFTKE